MMISTFTNHNIQSLVYVFKFVRVFATEKQTNDYDCFYRSSQRHDTIIAFENLLFLLSDTVEPYMTYVID